MVNKMKPEDFIGKWVKFTSRLKIDHTFKVEKVDGLDLISEKSVNIRVDYTKVTIVDEPEIIISVHLKDKLDYVISKNITNEIDLARTYINKISSSKERMIPFELTLNDWRVIKSKTCSDYTGKPFSDGLDRLSIERKNPREGYTVKNTIVCTLEENQVKANLDSFIHSDVFSDQVKIKILRSMIYQLEKGIKPV